MDSAGTAGGVPVAGRAVPVDADGSGVVTESARGRLQDVVGEFLDDLPRVPGDRGTQDPLDVHSNGVALEVAVGDQEEAVAALQLQGLDRVGGGLDAERGFGGDVEQLRSPVPQQLGPGVPGADQVRRTVRESDADQLAGHELVLSRVGEEAGVDRTGLFRW